MIDLNEIVRRKALELGTQLAMDGMRYGFSAVNERGERVDPATIVAPFAPELGAVDPDLFDLDKLQELLRSDGAVEAHPAPRTRDCSYGCCKAGDEFLLSYARPKP